LADFLSAAMRRDMPIVRPRDLADDLARHAREAYRRLSRQSAESLAPLQQALEHSLGLHFHGGEAGPGG
jgi:hypothetical protein